MSQSERYIMHTLTTMFICLWAGATYATDLIPGLEHALSANNSFFVLGMAFIAGILTSLSPCIYPLIPITLSVMGARKYESHVQGFMVALSYVSGMALVYAALGGLFAYIGVIMGALMQHPIVLISIALFFLLMALWMFGLFKMIIPESLMTRLTRIGGQGLKGAFLMGLVAGLLAAPCTGPVLGFILTLIASRKDIFLGFLLMIVFSIGMGLPFLLLGTFSSAIAHMPKSGRWMTTIKVILGLAMLVTAFYYAMLALPNSKHETEITHTENFIIIDDKTRDTTTFDRIINQAKQEGRPVMIDFYADWCTACLQLEKITFANATVSALLNHFVLIKIDSSRSSEYLVSIQNRFKVVGLPTIVFINKNGLLVEQAQILGFVTPEQFITRLGKQGLPN
jgi:thioredoxin:protein disulfide reductase